MKAIEKLNMIFHTGPKVSGRTQAMIEGAKSNPKIVVIAANEAHAKRLRERLPNNKVMTPESLYKLGGIHSPVVWDHFALEYVISQFLEELRDEKVPS